MLARDSSHVWQGEQAVLRTICDATVQDGLGGSSGYAWDEKRFAAGILSAFTLFFALPP